MPSVLIVDDSEGMRVLLRLLLEDLVSTAYECDDGAGALAAYLTHRPDWVLMDIEMDGMDGIAATRALRAADPHARIIIVSNYDDTELRRAASAAGAQAYVVKGNLLALRDLIESA